MRRTNHLAWRAIASMQAAQGGFALLEVVIAFVILAVGLGAVAVGIAVATRSDVRADGGRTAMRLAQSRLEAIGITAPLVPGRREGRFDGTRYTWRETISLAQVAVDRGIEAASPSSQKKSEIVRPFWVEIAVQTPEGSITKIGALKLASGPRQ